jgi:hypothetical protein
MIPHLSILVSRFNQYIQNLTSTNLGTLILSLTIYLLFSSIYFPESVFKKLNKSFSQNEIFIQDFVNHKIDHPLEATKNKDEGDHFMKRELRISPYLVGKIFHLNAIKLFYLQSLSLIAFIWFFFSTIKKLTDNDSSIAFWSVLAILFTYVGNSFNYDTLFYDSFAYLGLMLSIYFYDKKISIFFLIFSFFVDERAVIPSLILPIYFILNNYEFSKIPKGFIGLLKILVLNNKGFYFLAVSLFIYGIGRLVLYFQFGLRTPLGANSGIYIGTAFRFGINLYFAIFYSFKFYFIFPILTLIGLTRNKYYLIAFFYFLILFANIIVSISVEDVTRSMSFSFILIFITFKLAYEFKETIPLRHILYLMFIVHLITPTYTLLLSLIPMEPWRWAKLF